MEDSQNDLSRPRIRFARVSDATALAEFRYALRASEGRATEPRAEFVARCTAWMEIRLQDPARWQCWVAEEKDRLIGALWIQLIERVPVPRGETGPNAYLTNFYVDEGARGQGLGARLLQTAIEWCRTQNVHALILWPSDRSRSLYLRNGFAVREDLFELILNRTV